MRLPTGVLLATVSPLNRFSQRAYMASVLRILRAAGVSISGEPHWIAPTVLFDISEPGALEIGNQVVISQRVSILTHDYSMDRYSSAERALPEGLELIRRSPVKIRDYAFIGLGAILLPGVTVGERAIVAAGSVVTRSVRPGVVVAGNPAREVLSVEEWVAKSRHKYQEQRRRS